MKNKALRLIDRLLATRLLLGLALVALGIVTAFGDTPIGRYFETRTHIEDAALGVLMFLGGLFAILIPRSRFYGIFIFPLVIYCVASLDFAITGGRGLFLPAIYMSLVLYLLGLGELLNVNTHVVLIPGGPDAVLFVPNDPVKKVGLQMKVYFDLVFKNLLASKRFKSVFGYLFASIIIRTIPWLAPAADLITVCGGLLIGVLVGSYGVQDAIIASKTQAPSKEEPFSQVLAEVLAAIKVASDDGSKQIALELAKQLGSSVPAATHDELLKLSPVIQKET